MFRARAKARARGVVSAAQPEAEGSLRAAAAREGGERVRVSSPLPPR